MFIMFKKYILKMENKYLLYVNGINKRYISSSL